MNQLNHLFTGFLILFDPTTPEEEKARVKASIQRRVEDNLELINKVAKESSATTRKVTIQL